MVGEGIGFCGHVSLGGPGVGLFAAKHVYLRQMPGRLCGMTKDQNGKRAFVFTLSAREQHIRREKATSNICTNHALMALAYTITLSLYGKQGFVELARRNMQKTLFFRKQATRYGLRVAFQGPHFNETVLRFTNDQEVQERIEHLESEDVFPGVLLSRFYPSMDGYLLVSTTELHSDADLEWLASRLA